MSWTVQETTFNQAQITTNGNKFMIGNGALGYRGTLEEFAKDQLTATTVAGLYDKVGDQWREPVNAPNGLATKLFANGRLLSVLETEPVSHTQELDIRHAKHRRETVFAVDGGTVTLQAERFVSMDSLNLIVARFSVTCSQPTSVMVETGIDGDVWDINGPHLEQYQSSVEGSAIVLQAITHELRLPVVVAEALVADSVQQVILQTDKTIMRKLLLDCEAGVTYTFYKYVAIAAGQDDAEPVQTAVAAVTDAMAVGYEAQLDKHTSQWESKWALSDVAIEGDEEAQFALRYSLYHLLIIAPTESEKVSIPARGLSGQVYKGAVFWDTEMFMLPFFLHTDPQVARNLMMYRVHTLDGARRKAAEYGYKGAFYAWESQDTGDDACTLFNITDVFTNRPMRTYFRDKQVHISADVANGIWQYYASTGDESILLDGGAEVMMECARFFYSYAYYKVDKQRFEILDATGPDEYHERINNNVFTNYMAEQTISSTLAMLTLLQDKHAGVFRSLVDKLDYEADIEQLKTMLAQLYVPKPDPQTHIIEQFDGYLKLEDVTLPELKSRIINPNEYLGGGNGLATTTQILKQADTVLALFMLGDRFSREVKKANWDFYEPRTEHGSSLSPCVYALIAADIGYSEYAYRYFMKTATIDLTGNSKQYVGTLYIGGTHPAANGGAWMAAVQGFAGVRIDTCTVKLSPALPPKWSAMKFNVQVLGQQFSVDVSKSEVRITSAETNRSSQLFRIGGAEVVCEAGQTVVQTY
ncbi:glycoside hydrolase family 65 protein [Paenibacillus athensensis]|nr:glycosyl hydrolase family 65 protein [Paenibacillus athensensis]MCD1258119.1 glycoside hydrolase family 65 protein [Paenibacillus athensensis]